MKTNDVNLKRVLLLLFTFTTICSWAQTPAWQQQLDKLDKEADLLYEKGNWKKLVANQEQYRKIVMAQPDSVKMEYLWDTDLDGNFYFNLTCFQTLAGDKKEALKTFEYYTDRVIDREEINLQMINNDSDLNAIRKEPRFKDCMERLTAWGDYKQKLKDAKPYYSGTLPEGIKFHYASPNDPD